MTLQGRLVNCRPLAESFLEQAANKIKVARIKPKIAMITVGNPEEKYRYPHKHARAIAEKLGIGWKNRVLPVESGKNEALAAIASLNADPSITGIVLHRPLPEHLSIKDLQQAVHPGKDVEGMHPSSLGQIIYQGSNGMRKSSGEPLWPCTAKAAVEILKYAMQESMHHNELMGVEVLVIGTSDVLAKPVCSLLYAEGATVTTCPPDIPNLSAHTRAADVVISAVSNGQGLITGEMLKPGCIVIDLGINRIERTEKIPSSNATKVQYKVVGDVDTASVLPVAGSMSNLSGGVGIVRTAILMNNIANAVMEN
mmetsp:Transcript_16924/g.20338  ORF Transcript_16924/g.20338 Transcript_16924/m.20338 type:complete len:311 (-) Transcript_16924:362-1294(-)